jgi:hypothetical protein
MGAWPIGRLNSTAATCCSPMPTGGSFRLTCWSLGHRHKLWPRPKACSLARSGWIKIAEDAAEAEAPDITLKRLRIIIGRVLDRRGQPVDGATVFNSGDGHERIEARSKGGGKFLLTDVPEGGVFLFAEKPGYRFTGMRLPPDEAQATLVLTALDEPADPKPTLPPLLTADEEYALARSVLDPWLERLAKSGTPDQRIRGFSSLIQINGQEAFHRSRRRRLRPGSYRWPNGSILISAANFFGGRWLCGCRVPVEAVSIITQNDRTSS